MIKLHSVPHWLAALLSVMLTSAAADEFSIKLKPGLGHDIVESQCAACHSLDYIITNSPFPTAKVWEAEVTKMIKTYGAGLSPEDAKAASDYLAKNYGG